ncbi:MAG: hypothetical protein V1856_01620 [Candidatus Liptonbacteria bacterium]
MKKLKDVKLPVSEGVGAGEDRYPLSRDRRRAEDTLPTEFGGTFVPDSRSDGGLPGSWQYCQEAREEEERVSEGDWLHWRVEIEEVPAEQPSLCHPALTEPDPMDELEGLDKPFCS